MSEPQNPYRAVIADLKRKRDQIDQTIRSLEELSGGTVLQSSLIPSEHEDQGTSGGAFLGLSIPEASKQLLHVRKKPLGNVEMVEGLEAGGVVFTSGNKTNTVSSILNRRSKQVGDIVSVARGRWGLKEWYPNRRFDRKGGNGEQAEEETNGDESDAVTGDSNGSNEPVRLVTLTQTAPET